MHYFLISFILRCYFHFTVTKLKVFITLSFEINVMQVLSSEFRVRFHPTFPIGNSTACLFWTPASGCPPVFPVVDFAFHVPLVYSPSNFIVARRCITGVPVYGDCIKGSRRARERRLFPAAFLRPFCSICHVTR